MSLIVQKYGGTSVGTPERIKAVAARVKAWRDRGHQVVVVVSAMSGETDRLLALAKSVQTRPLLRELDVLLATGEQVTIALLSMALDEIRCPARSYTGAQVHILTDSAHSKARIRDIDAARVQADLAAGRVVVVAGFQGVDETGNITTLGRGGSDTSAVALAAALKADECQIYTDVDGVYTTDPRIEPRARRLARITFEEMLEMASLGSKVLQIRSVEFAGKYRVPLRVLSSFGEGEGTLITFEEGSVEEAKIAGIAFARDEAKLTLLGVPDQPGVAHRILGPIAEANIEVDMIVQNVAADEATTDFTFTVHRNDYPRAYEILEHAAAELGARQVVGDERIVKVSLVGVGMRSHAGIASKMFAALAKEGINIRMISTSEIKISVVIDERYLELGVRALHEAFDLDTAAA
ncbi:aspartate kinase [Thioalkalicoccus limnaeus]|uniref:Aspartokinase n=1 Tax=Thioalkalicoccus limnaeus TaxID=120681 RepID=A0ABV4BCT4_9GAMM